VRLSGATSIVLDMNEQRLDFCQQTMGVTHTVTYKGDGTELDRLKELTDGALPTIVIDATGSARSMSNALNYVAHTGKLVYVGITTDELKFPHPLMHRRELTLYASRNAMPSDFDRIIHHIEDGRIDTRPWITHRTSFDDMIGNFPSYLRPETGVIKAIVEVN
jgi:threonine dehydrogenase-like Zn-dependent dehydrogenase